MRSSPHHTKIAYALGLIGALGSLACDGTAGRAEPIGLAVPVEVAPSEPVVAVTKLAVGDGVVGRWLGHRFEEGKVDKVSPRRALISWTDGSDPSEVGRVDVMALPGIDDQVRAKAGDLVLAKPRGESGPTWTGAEVLSVDAGVARVRFIDDGAEGEHHNLDGSRVIVPPPHIRADLRDLRENKAVEDGAAGAGMPRRPEGYAPEPGTRVVGFWREIYWEGGRVKSVAGTNVTLTWDDGSDATTLPVDHVVPLPEANEPMPAVGRYVLVAPKAGDSRWVAARVDAVDGAEATLRLTTGATAKRVASRLIVIEP